MGFWDQVRWGSVAEASRPLAKLGLGEGTRCMLHATRALELWTTGSG
eukprot:CAMPEP_0194774454 /NCGR_PEP_ID=MMETSP0323_2-20130528/57687_1 /TAXON_ID=2866 ORGANISM="Crypthecodinium cohnii, Strain Seligo" /NCGR_SAMPLE_ID=MMETSP0323_2 /ASSEMBLY_ACC=CAM_ASM_000346 /LENGTH=46 /DNA_ID= /DNA_START= /DNA_END= /DNA_ORIENTATION=